MYFYLFFETAFHLHLAISFFLNSAHENYLPILFATSAIQQSLFILQ